MALCWCSDDLPRCEALAAHSPPHEQATYIRLPFDTAVFLQQAVLEPWPAISAVLRPVTSALRRSARSATSFGTADRAHRPRPLCRHGQRLERAVSADLGAGPLATFRQVTLPRLAPAIIAAAALVFTLCIDDVLISLFTSGAGNETWPL